MVKKTNKTKSVCLIVLLVIVLAVVSFGIVRNINFKKDNEMTDLERISKVLSTTKPTSVFVRGDIVDFSGYCEGISINQISLDTIESDKEYTVIVINDLNDNVSLSDDEIKLTKELIGQNNIMLAYLGKKYSTTWDDPTKGIASIEGNLCYIYYSWDGVPSRNIGMWTQSDQDLLSQYPFSLGESLLYAIEEYLQ